MKIFKNIIISLLFIILLIGLYLIYIDGGYKHEDVKPKEGGVLPVFEDKPISPLRGGIQESSDLEKGDNDAISEVKVSFNITDKKYIDNGDGTITDLDTGLMWTEDYYGKTDYSNINQYIKNYSDYDDWRVPNIKELYSLMDFSGIDPNSNSTSTSGLIPFIDTNYFNFRYGDISNGDRIIDSQWITTNIYTSTVMKNEQCFFGVNFADGRIKCYPINNVRNNGYFLRLVRGNEYGRNDFVDNGNGTVTDKITDLTWQKNDSSKGLDWYEAIDYCDNLEISGITNWRLPNIKELQYIVDYLKSPDLTNTAAIDSIFNISSIKNEAGEVDYPYFWSDTTHLNHNGNDFAAYISFGRAMGKMNGVWLDVHGAGAQRSDPKSGNPDDYPNGFGPQGDARRIYNYVRCVNDGI